MDQQSLHKHDGTTLPPAFQHDSMTRRTGDRQDACPTRVATNAGGRTLLLVGGVESVCITAMQNNFFAILALTCLLFWGAGCVTTEKGDLKFGVPGKDTLVRRYAAPCDNF